MKIYLKICSIILLCFCILSVHTAPAKTCTDNPLWSSFKQWVQDEQFGQKTIKDLETGIQQFEQNKPVAQSDLGFCKQFNGQNTCCTAKLINGAKQLVMQKFQKYANKKPLFAQILARLKPAAKKCSAGGQGNQQSKSDAAPEQNANNGVNGQINKQYKQCYAQILKASVKFARGNFCALCINPANFTDYFDSEGKLLLNSQTFNQYLQDTKQGFECLNQLSSQFNETVNKFFETYADLTNSKCSEAKQKINNLLNNSAICPNNDCLTMIKSTIKLFGDGAEAQATISDSQADTNVGASARLLQTSYSQFKLVDGGVQTYISDPDDSQIQYDGVYPDGTEAQAESSNIQIFGLLLLMTLLMLQALII